MFKTLSKTCEHTARCVLKRYNGSLAVNPVVLKKLDKGYDRLMKSNSKSLLKKHLTQELFEQLKTKRTKSSTLLDCIQSGLAHHDAPCGVYASCAESYKGFAGLFDRIIEDYHFGFKSTDKQPAENFGDHTLFKDVDPLNHYVASTRIRCSRSIQGFPFNPCMTKKQYEQIEEMVQPTLYALKNEFKGTFHPLLGMSKPIRAKLVRDHFLFESGDRFLHTAKACRFWPIGRGVFQNFDQTFFVWCNERDHLRIISMQRGGDFAEVYNRLIRGIAAIEDSIPFTRDERLGFLTFSPRNLGTTIHASVRIRVHKLAANKDILNRIALKHNLRIRGTSGKHTSDKSDMYDISNRRILGITEFQAVEDLYTGIREIIQLESGEKDIPIVEEKLRRYAFL